MPNFGSKLAYFLAARDASWRALVGCGVMSAFNTSQRTRMSLGPRSGSLHVHTGIKTQSEKWPVAWLVDDPSKPQMIGFLPSAMMRVLERNSGVGSVPSIQMYSA